MSESSCTFVQTAVPGNAQPLTMPVDGTVVRWCVRSVLVSVRAAGS